MQTQSTVLPEGGTNVKRKVIARTGLQIAIDGPAGAGKSTVAKLVADKLNYLYIDTGAMYRAATWLALQKGLEIDDADGIARALSKCKIELTPGEADGQKIHVFVDGNEITNDIRTQEITRLVSPLSTIKSVRHQLVEQQRKLAAHGSVVLDGRDIGTVVLPRADVKIFLTASPEVRAKRRLAELEGKSERVDYETILKDIIERDHRDSNREIAPLQMADDAVLILSDNMTIDEVVSHIVQLCS